MHDLESRAQQAEQLWRRGDRALDGGDAVLAYRLYTEAHDRVTDCPRLHLRAHHQLRRVTRHHANKAEFITDSLLVVLAPLGVFELIAFFLRSRVSGAGICRRS